MKLFLAMLCIPPSIYNNWSNSLAFLHCCCSWFFTTIWNPTNSFSIKNISWDELLKKLVLHKVWFLLSCIWIMVLVAWIKGMLKGEGRGFLTKEFCTVNYASSSWVWSLKSLRRTFIFFVSGGPNQNTS